MTVYIVRHALAVPKKRWTGDDDDRPLTTRGGAQASVLTKWSKTASLASIVSSPARRCTATVEGIAKALDQIKNRTYGTCADCGETIPMARLEAYPFADRCIRCATAVEAEAGRRIR